MDWTAVRAKSKIFFRKGATAFVLASPLLLGHVSLSYAVPIFGASTDWRVAGDCNTAVSFERTGGNSISSTLSSTTKAGLTTNCGIRYPAGGWEAQASASANLGTGQLKAFASGHSPESNFDTFTASDPAFINVRVDANAAMFDTVRLIVPADFAGPFAVIPIRYHVDYDVSLDPGVSSARNLALISWTLQTSSSIRDLRSQGCDTEGVSSLICFREDLFHTLVVPIANPEFFVRATLGARSQNSATADASATGSLSFELPAGFSFESDSGVLLRSLSLPPPVDGSVPEPGSLALVALGLAALLSRRRR